MATYEVLARKKIRDASLPSEEYVVKAMPPILGSVDMVALYILIVFFITNSNTAVSGGPSAFTYLAIGAVAFFIPSVIAAAQLGTMFPHDGSLYNWTHKAFGGYWSFFVAFCAWFPGVLVMISAGSVVVSLIQGLNANWLAAPWQQGLVIVGLIVFSCLFSMQRFRIVQNVINVAAGLTLLGVVIIGIAGAAWLLTGHGAQTDFSQPASWGINFNFNTGNIGLFGLITLAYLGCESPLNMGGEVGKRRAITRHLLWGTALALVGYFVATFTLLVVEGATKGSSSYFSLIQAADVALGKGAGNLVFLCLMSFFVMTISVYNCSYSRLLLVASIDQRLPLGLGKLNRNRVPSNAIILQTVLACAITALMYFIAPNFTTFGSNISADVYNVTLASSTLVWAISSMFLFINLGRFYFLDRVAFRKQLIFPLPVIWLAIMLGSASCILAIADSLFLSWIPSLIPNASWWYIIGGLTGIYLIIAAVGSMIASSEAAWEGVARE